MGQSLSDAYTGPYRDPESNIAHSLVTNAGKTGSDDSALSPEAEAGIKKVNNKIDDAVVGVLKGKAPLPPKPAAPKPPAIAAYKTSDYALARNARKAK